MLRQEPSCSVSCSVLSRASAEPRENDKDTHSIMKGSSAGKLGQNEAATGTGGSETVEHQPPSARTRVKTLAQRGVYDPEIIYEILDEAMFCTVAYVSDRGDPVVIPTGYGRRGNFIYLHGKANAGMLTAIADGRQICITVFIADGIVVARSAFHHSINYRSVVIYGQAEVVMDPEEVDVALRTVVDHIVPGRWDNCRHPSSAELKSTKVLRVCIDEASAKIRTGQANDDKPDVELDYWAGVLPMQTVFGEPITNSDVRAGIAVPPEIAHYRRPNQPDQRERRLLRQRAASLALGLPVLGLVISLCVARARSSR